MKLLKRIKKLPRLVKSLGFIWKAPKVDILLVDEISFRLLPLFEESVKVRVQKIRDPKYYFSLSILYQYILISLKMRKIKDSGFQEKYMYALSKVIQCKLVITCTDYNGWDRLLIQSSGSPRVMVFQLGLRDGTEYSKKFDILVSWGNGISKETEASHLLPIGSLSYALYKDSAEKLDAEADVDILIISVLRTSNIDRNIPVNARVIDALEKICTFSSQIVEGTDRQLAFAYNSKQLASWHSEKVRKDSYKAVLNSEIALTNKYLSNKLGKCFYRSPIGAEHSTYFGIETSKLVVGFFSSILFEAIGIGRKVLFTHNAVGAPFDALMKPFEPYIPEIMNLRTFQYSEFETKANNLLRMSQTEYIELTYELRYRFINQQADYIKRTKDTIRDFLE